MAKEPDFKMRPNFSGVLIKITWTHDWVGTTGQISNLLIKNLQEIQQLTHILNLENCNQT
ncbi:hypothetical protein A4D02_14135 [Niastella koreensis]|uniref:Uncharacterized protein n=2 Tax=Niastella koreensis TaxID=354356 RepID=G8TRG6_NIAKG|nr:hypothetical protein Niako_4849 [Niastella koreensis GR20-10]OQP41814.1 hypothetical protein A4D02_14135 [Niastella koreensis]